MGAVLFFEQKQGASMGDHRATIEVKKHSIEGDSPLGMLLGVLLDKISQDEDDSEKDKKERVIFRDVTKEEALEHIAQTSYVPMPLDVVRLNKFATKFMKFPQHIETMTVIRVLPEPLYDTTNLYGVKGGVAFNTILGCMAEGGRFVEMIYPSAYLELAERDAD